MSERVPTESLERATQLMRAGRFLDALRALDEGSLPPASRPAASVLRARLLEQRGEYPRAVELASGLLESKSLTASQQSQCEAVVGRVLFEAGDTEQGLVRLQRAALLAQQAGDLHALFDAQLLLLVKLSDRSGPAAASSFLADVRQIATKLGDPWVTARLHLFVGQSEAMRGLLESARRHIVIARRILSTAPNVYLEGFADNLDLAVAMVRSEFEVARACGARAVELAEQAGSARIRGAALGNMAILLYELGDFEQAIGYIEEAFRNPVTSGAHNAGLLDSLARVYLIQGRADSSASVLDQVEASIQVEQDRLIYQHRYSALTRIELLAWLGRNDEALARIDDVLDLAARAGDGVLQKQVQVTKAAVLERAGQLASSMTLIADIVPDLAGASPELYARSEQILACALASQGDAAGAAHRDRAHRIYHAIGSVPRQTELAHYWRQAQASAQPAAGEPAQRPLRQALHGIAAAFSHAVRPDIIASELLEVLIASGCTDTARAIIRSADGAEEAIGVSTSSVSDSTVAERRLSVGFRGDREVQLLIRPKPDVESVASVNAITLLLTSLHELRRSRAEREEKATLWPIEELPIDDDRAVVSGRMRELMNYARRIAKTKVNVLITGESGTGKEILARAIHDFSDRAAKPFVPFNCTAIPRDLLESQLFGHRRGAFTGADRDYPGLIRSAREGTLFLDEIGELGLDLQPKLLRFLESGEISPLGEPGSISVDVRIVAATNSHLEDAVRDSRFREDLFYRLNVVRLTIPPLRERRDEIPAFVNHFAARAAAEFGKGQIRVAEETMERLLLYRWPGNVRQLQNEVRRMVALAEPDSVILPHAISAEILGALSVFRQSADGREISVDLHAKLLPTVARIEAEMITAALSMHDGKVDAAAKALGISRKGLYLKRQRLGV